MTAGNTSDGLAYDSQNGNIYVTNFNPTGYYNLHPEGVSYNVTVPKGTVSVISSLTNQVTASIAGIWNATGIAFDPDNGYLYVAGLPGPHYIEEGSSEICGNVPPTYTGREVCSPLVYIVDGRNNSVVGYICETLQNRGCLGSGIFWRVVYNPYNDFVYVTEVGENSVIVINASSNEIIPTSTPYGSFGVPYSDCYYDVSGLAVDATNGNLYVDCGYTGTVFVVSGMVGLAVQGATASVGFDPENGYIYVPGCGGVCVMNGSPNGTEIGTIATSGPVTIPVYDSTTSLMYTFSVNSTGNFPSYGLPPDSVFDPSNQYIYYIGSIDSVTIVSIG